MFIKELIGTVTETQVHWEHNKIPLIQNIKILKGNENKVRTRTVLEETKCTVHKIDPKNPHSANRTQLTVLQLLNTELKAEKKNL